MFCDDFAFDVRGSLYCGTDPFNTLLRIAPAGSVQTLPTAAAFNHQGERRWVGETRSQQAGMGSEDTEGGLRLGFGRAVAHYAEPLTGWRMIVLSRSGAVRRGSPR